MLKTGHKQHQYIILPKRTQNTHIMLEIFCLVNLYKQHMKAKCQKLRFHANLGKHKNNVSKEN